MLPPDPVEFWLKRWLGGVVLPVGLVLYGSFSIATRHSYAIFFGVYGRFHFIEVSGLQADLMGIAFISVSLALFAYCYAPYSEVFSRLSTVGLIVGLLGFATCVTWCSWLFLAE